MIPVAMIPEVLPWSWAVPMVVYRLMCSIERQAGADRASDVGDGRVPLQVDELGDAVRGRSGRVPAKAPAGRPPRQHRLHSGTTSASAVAMPACGQCFPRGPVAVGQAPGEGENAGRGSGNGQPLEIARRAGTHPAARRSGAGRGTG